MCYDVVIAVRIFFKARYDTVARCTKSSLWGNIVPLEDLSGNFVLRSKLNRLLQGVAVRAFRALIVPYFS